MKYLCLENIGELDPRGITLIGASSKRGTDAIGEFGSGFSYALGVLLRNKLSVRIFAGEAEITVEARQEDFRGQTVNVLFVNGERTSLTLEIGPKWLKEEAVREIWSNALDEGEAQKWVTDDIIGRPGYTRVYIQFDRAISDMLCEWNSYFISPEVKPLWKNADIAIYSPEDTGGVATYFRRGVRICNDTQHPPLFSFSLTNVDLPESRNKSSNSLAYDAAYKLYHCDNRVVVQKYLEALQDQSVAYPPLELARIPTRSSKFGDTLKQLLAEQGITHAAAEPSRKFIKSEHHSKILWLTPGALNVLFDITKVSDALTDFIEAPYKRLPMPGDMRRQLNEELPLLAYAGMGFDDIDIIYGEFTNPDQLAGADIKARTIILGTKLNIERPRELRKALIEEYIHIKFEVLDFTVAQQHAYLDLLCRAVEPR